MLQGDLDGAQNDLTQSLGLYRELKDSGNIMEGQMLAARLALERSQGGKAAPLARQALTTARKTSSIAAQARCQLLIARAALEHAASAEAQTALAEANVLIHKNPLPDLQLMYAALSAQAKARLQAAEAEKDLEAAMMKAGGKSSFDVQLESRIIAAVLQSQSGNAIAAATALAAIEKEAREHGFLLAARRAKAAGSNGL